MRTWIQTLLVSGILLGGLLAGPIGRLQAAPPETKRKAVDTVATASASGSSRATAKAPVSETTAEDEAELTLNARFALVALKLAKVNLAQEGKGKRSWKNVFGSGLIPMLFSIGIHLAKPGVLFASIDPFWSFAMFGGFIGAIATTAADTLASEIGVFSKSKPRLITNLRRKVPRGTIGAVSLLGEGVAVLAGVFIGAIALVFALVAPAWVPLPCLALS